MGVYISNIVMPTCEKECKLYDEAPFRPYPYCAINLNYHEIDNCPYSTWLKWLQKEGPVWITK